jgi:hypothetical protein
MGRAGITDAAMPLVISVFMAQISTVIVDTGKGEKLWVQELQ